MYGYHFALNCTKAKLEVRYVLESLEPLLKSFKESLDNPQMTMFDPNIGIVQDLSVFSTNIVFFEGKRQSDAERPQLYRFDEKLFNATTALVTEIFQITPKFTTQFDFGFVMLIHKKNVAKFYVVVMFDDFDEIDEYWEQIKLAFYYDSASEYD